jgi:RHS repeat-associated protein
VLGVGLINMRGRVYDPATATFLTPDPVVSSIKVAGWNKYSYVSNNPLKYTDPSGFEQIKESHASGRTETYNIDMTISEPAPPAAPWSLEMFSFNTIDSVNVGMSDNGGYIPASAPNGGGDRFNPYDPVQPGTSVFGERPYGGHVDYSRPPTAQSLISPFLDGFESAANAPTLDDYGQQIPATSVFRFAMAVAFLPLAELKGAGSLLAAERGAVTIDTALVQFSQDSVKGAFRNGTTLNQAAAALRAGGQEAAAAYPAIRLFQRNGMLHTLDNRRLLVFSEAGMQVPFRMATEAEIAREFTSKFTTTAAQGWGKFISVRP